jgi:hypothetical protein
MASGFRHHRLGTTCFSVFDSLACVPVQKSESLAFFLFAELGHPTRSHTEKHVNYAFFFGKLISHADE